MAHDNNPERQEERHSRDRNSDPGRPSRPSQKPRQPTYPDVGGGEVQPIKQTPAERNISRRR